MFGAKKCGTSHGVDVQACQSLFLEASLTVTYWTLKLVALNPVLQVPQSPPLESRKPASTPQLSSFRVAHDCSWRKFGGLVFFSIFRSRCGTSLDSVVMQRRLSFGQTLVLTTDVARHRIAMLRLKLAAQVFSSAI